MRPNLLRRAWKASRRVIFRGSDQVHDKTRRAGPGNTTALYLARGFGSGPALRRS